MLDLSAYIAGPYWLHVAGRPRRARHQDRAARWRQPAQVSFDAAGESRAFIGINRSKLGVALDLKKAEGLAALLRLVRTADVLVHNFRPGVLKRLGIDFDQLSQINPRLIYCAVTGYGEKGPLKDA